MKEQSIYVSGSNYFNNDDLNNMTRLLEEGKTIEVGISCIGHTRNNMEQEHYKNALEEHYGDKLEVMLNEGGYSYSYKYRLK